MNTATSSEKASLLIGWSIQEIRRIAIKLAHRRIQPARVIAWSLWRRAHQAEARRAHLKGNTTVMLGRETAMLLMKSCRCTAFLPAWLRELSCNKRSQIGNLRPDWSSRAFFRSGKGPA